MAEATPYPSSSQFVSRFLPIGGNVETEGNETGNEVPKRCRLLYRIGNEGESQHLKKPNFSESLQIYWSVIVAFVAAAL